MNHRIILFLLLGIDAFILIFQTSELSISYYEASLIYSESSFLSYLINSSLNLFGHNDFALRIPMIILHSLSGILLYITSKKYVVSQRNRLWLVFIFILLPGILSSSLIVNSAGLVIFSLFFFIYIFQEFDKKYLYPLLLLYIFVDNSLIYLFLALIFYSLYQNDKKFLIYNTLLLLISIYIYGLEVYGVPKGHFLDTLGVYATVFTPIIFIYIFYVLYRRLLIKELDIIWFISSVALIVSLLLSFRQRILIEDFAPYLMVALPLAAQTFNRSYRIRLHLFRKKYKVIFMLSVVFLILNAFVVLFNKEIYRFIENPKKHFAYDMHVAKELATELINKDISCIDTEERMITRLSFYGIKPCKEYILEKLPLNTTMSSDVTISYKGRIVYRGNVTKVNN